MEAFARLLVRRPVAWGIVVVTSLWIAFGALFAGKVRQEDDLLAFLPSDSTEVAEFKAIAERFGGLEVALIGVETPDVFDPAFLARLADATERLQGVQGVDRVLTLSNVQDFVEDPTVGGVRITDLVDHLPTDDGDREALTSKVLSRDHVAGTLVSRDGKAVVLYCFLAWGSEPRVVGEGLRAVATEVFPDDHLYWGGAPFINTWIYETTQKDLKRLVPWAVIVIAGITLLSFRDLFGALLGLFATTVGIVSARGLMGFLDVPDNLVLASMPVVLFAVGSAYSIHVLARYYGMVADGMTSDEAVVSALRDTGAPILGAGGTTVVGLLSFVTMDIEPVRTFGVFSAIGVMVAMTVALTFVPAVIVLWRPRPYIEPTGALGRSVGDVMNWVQTHRVPVGAVVAVAFAVALFGATRVDERMDDTAFFGPKSPPAQATAFLDARFGGSRFLQVQVEGDLQDPDVLREIQRVSDRMATVPGVVDVQSVPKVIALVNQSMTGARRIPDTRGQVGVLYGFLAGDPSVDQLVTSERTEGLLLVRLSAADIDAIDAATDGVRAVLDTSLTRYDVGTDPAAMAWLVDAVALRVEAVARVRGGGVSDPTTLRARLAGARPAADEAVVRQTLERFLASEENFVPLDPPVAAAVASAVAALGADPDEEALRAAIATTVGPDVDAMLPDDLVMALVGPLPDAWRRASATAFAQALVAEGLVTGPADEAFTGEVAATLLDLDGRNGLAPSTSPDAHVLSWTLSGQPILYEAMSRSVAGNQVRSIVFAMLCVSVILTLLLGSVRAGLLASMPMVVTLSTVYGIMGYAGVRLDIGTSMIASLVIGDGADYALHMLETWRDKGGNVKVAARNAARLTATPILTNAGMVAAGFFVLTLGEAKPLQNVGALVSGAMLLAAFVTFVVIPLLAGRSHYGR